MAVIGRISEEVLEMICGYNPEKDSPCPEDTGGVFTPAEPHKKTEAETEKAEEKK